MSPVIETYNEYHLGDNLIHLNWLRKVAHQHPDKHFIHYMEPIYFEQAEDVIETDSNIKLAPLSERSTSAVNVWINAEGLFEIEPYRRNWVFFHLEHFKRLAKKLNVVNPAISRDDLLMDYPALTKDNPLCKPIDYLVINSRPHSGQFIQFNPNLFVTLVGTLCKQGAVVTTEDTGLAPFTRDYNLSVSQIGSLSRFAHTIIAVDTGPLWPTFNIWNRQSLRIIFCNRQHFPLTDHVIVMDSVSLVPNILTQLARP